MIFYPYDAPIILTDDIFVSYGGHTGTTTSFQRQAAYLMAEMTAYDDLHTFLLPTVVTGTYAYKEKLVLELNFISSIRSVFFLNAKEEVYWSVSGTANSYVSLIDADRGVLDMPKLLGVCYTTPPTPTSVSIVFEAGLPTGTANQPDMLMALTTYADLMLNEIVGFGNESPGDIGVQRFSNQDYNEQRVYLYQTAWGTSPKARLAHRLLGRYRKRKWVSL
jgi:hypothetical protein